MTRLDLDSGCVGDFIWPQGSQPEDCRIQNPDDGPAGIDRLSSVPDQRFNWMDPKSPGDSTGYYPGKTPEILENADFRISETCEARHAATSFRPGRNAGPVPRPEVLNMSDSDSGVV